MPVANSAYAAYSTTEDLKPYKFETRDPTEGEVLVEVHYCGLCHSDIHTVRGEWSEWGIPPQAFPIVPGHEFTGVVAKVGSSVSKFQPGDRVGVGCLVNSCKTCDACKRDLENYCNAPDYTYPCDHLGNPTRGGYGRYVNCHQDCLIRIPDSLPLDRAAPLLCAGITTYSPCFSTDVHKGNKHVGVIGLGGLGHMAVQWAASFSGNTVYVFTRTAEKKDLAMQLGASNVIISSDPEDMKKYTQKLDVIIDTVSANKPMEGYLNTLNLDGTIVMVGAPPSDNQPKMNCMAMIMRRRKIMGSAIGGIKETQEMVNYSAEKNILPHIELISCDKVNEAYVRVLKSDVKFRFVFDVKNTYPKME